jgi:hypothetical protein
VHLSFTGTVSIHNVTSILETSSSGVRDTIDILNADELNALFSIAFQEVEKNPATPGIVPEVNDNPILKSLIGIENLPVKREYLEAMLDVHDFRLNRKSKHENLQAYRQLFDFKMQADTFYWQVFPLLTAAEAFILYISVGSGSSTDDSELFSRVLMSIVGISFVVISWISFHINKSKLDVYTKRLFWVEVRCKYPIIHAKDVMVINDRRNFLQFSMYAYWTDFFRVLICTHVLCIFNAVGLNWKAKSGIQVLLFLPILWFLRPFWHHMFEAVNKWCEKHLWATMLLLILLVLLVILLAFLL